MCNFGCHTVLSGKKISCVEVANGILIQYVDFKADVQISTRIHIITARNSIPAHCMNQEIKLSA